jgi:hypothetical protein
MIDADGTLAAIPDELLLDGRLRKYDVEAETVEGPFNKVTHLSHVDGDLYSNQDASRLCTEFSQALLYPWSILVAIEKEFNVTIVDEDDPRFGDLLPNKS